jgi:hydroxyacylglutathione hydrolase
MKINLYPIPAFSDNYLWLFNEPGSHLAWVVDPGDAAAVIAALAEHHLMLAGILVTHHHGDHVGGIADLLKHSPVPVYGPSHSPASALFSQTVKQGEHLQLGHFSWEVMAVPGHTLEHIAYYSAEAGVLFCGDTLFSAGCGRLFEGTAEQMFHSLQQFAALPDATQVCCAHEYTLSNLRFAVAAEPDNTVIRQHQQHCLQLREQQQPTLPSSIGLEKQINPFLRAVDVETLAARRRWKDDF